MSPKGKVRNVGMRGRPHKGRRVVVVDGDGAVRESLTFLLETAGYAVTTHASGPECLAGFNPDATLCLVVDHLLPQMTGLELLEELRRRGVQTPAVLMLETPAPDLRHRAAQQGIARVLSKLDVESELLQFVADAARSNP